MWNVRAGAGAALFVAGVLSCTHQPSLEELSTQTVVVTQFTPDTDFGAYRTFAMSDSIEVITENQSGTGQSTAPPANPEIAAQTLEAVATELTRRGYTRVSRTEAPDLGVAVNGVIRQHAVATYGAWWGSGGATGGSFGYPGATFGTGISSGGVALWRSGALVIELYDLRAARAAQGQPLFAIAAGTDAGADAGATSTLIEVVWGALIYGVLGGGTEATLTRVPIADIQQAFAQSPYLQAR